MSTNTMQAAVYQGTEKITVKQVPIQQISENEILLKIKTCAICGTDVRIFRHGSPIVVPPAITGHELAGVVVEVGSRTSGFKKGDRVTIATSTPCLECTACQSGCYNICDYLKGIGYHLPGGFAGYMKFPGAPFEAKYLL